MSWKHSGIKLCINLLQCPRLCAQPALSQGFSLDPGPSFWCWMQSKTQNLHVLDHAYPRVTLAIVSFQLHFPSFFYVFIFGQGQQIDDGVTDPQCILGKARNVVINSRRFSFTMAYCLAVRGSEPVAAEPQWQGYNH